MPINIIELLEKTKYLFTKFESRPPQAWEEVASFLKRMNISYKKMNHSSTVACEEVAPKYKEFGFNGGHCKNLFVTDGYVFLLIVVEKDKLVDLAHLKRMLETKKLSFASSDQISSYLGVKIGELSIFNLLNDKNKWIKLVFDAELMNYKDLAFHPNDNSKTFFIPTNEMSKIIAALGHKTHILNVPSKAKVIQDEKINNNTNGLTYIKRLPQ